MGVGACFERLILELLLMSCFPRITSSPPVIQFDSVLSNQKKATILLKLKNGLVFKTSEMEHFLPAHNSTVSNEIIV